MSIPFVEKGRDETGCDCWGLVRLIYKNELGIDLPDYLDVYEDTNDKAAIMGTIETEGDSLWEHPDTPNMYDVVLVHMRGVPMHMGIITKPNHMIHCAKGVNTVHEHLGTVKWKYKIVGYGRWKI